MRYLSCFLSICWLLLAGCAAKKADKTITIPQIDRFEITQNGEILFYGKGIDSLKTLDISFNFSIGMHDFLGNTQLVAFGKHPVIKNDSTLAIPSSSLERIEMAVPDFDTLNKDIRVMADASRKGKASKLILKKALHQPFLSLLGSTKGDYALWLTLEDKTKQFWNPADKMNTTFKFGFYQLMKLQKGNFSSYNQPEMAWSELQKQ